MNKDVGGAGAEGALSVERRGAAAVITLARPAGRNALTIAMRARLATVLSGFGRDPNLYAVILRSAVPGTFSVGGDVREITSLARSNLAEARKGLADELMLCWIVECLSKPIVSLIDGHVMGTGVGISLYNTHRVAGAQFRFSMPETQIGYFPDCAVARTFGQMPSGVGLYLGLTGEAIGPADALALGLVTHCIPAERYAEIEAHLTDADPVDPVLDALHVDPGPSGLMANGATIERYFSAPSLAEILGRLQSASGPDKAFADRTLATLATRSPLALAVTDRMIRQAARMDIREALLQDYRLAYRFAALPDFQEGVRAFLVDKDKAPRWQLSSPGEASAELIGQLFAPLGSEELPLPTRKEMQAARL